MPSPNDIFICMMCSQEVHDAFEVLDDGYWIYCKACDCWTNHPFEAEIQEEPRR